jgi:hypothetical protein
MVRPPHRKPMNNLTVTIDKHAVMPIWDREEHRNIGTGKGGEIRWN